MRGFALLMALAFGSVIVAGSGPASAQESFGQVKFGVYSPAPPAASKPETVGANVSGVTVTAKRIPDSQRDPDEVLCHEEIPIGSRFAKKICATRRQYAERRQFDQEQLYEWTQGKPLTVH